MVNQYYFNSNDETRECQRFSYNCKSEFESAFRHLVYNSWSDPKNPKLTVEKFARRWLDDPEAKISQTIEFNPENKSERQMLDKPWKSGDYNCNLFTGYSDRINAQYDDKDETSLNMWLKIVTELCEGNEQHRDYLLKLIAMKIRYPTKKIPIGIVLKGPQGSGKSQFIESIGRIFGDRHYIISSKVNDFFGDYAEGFCNKLLVNMNETEGKDTLDIQGRMKEFITEDKITVNPKFIRGYSVKNYALLVVTSNKANPIAIDVVSGDRRWVIFQSTTKFVNMPKPHWEKLLNMFREASFTAQLYSFLSSLDISDFNPSKDRPITQSYRQMAQNSIPAIILWLEDKYRNEFKQSKTEIYAFEKQSQELESKKGYGEFINFQEQNGLAHEKVTSIKKFYDEIRQLSQKGCKIELVDDTHKKFGKEIKFTYGDVFRP